VRFFVVVLIVIPIVSAAVLTARARSDRERALARMCGDASLAFSPSDPFLFTDTAFLPFPMFAPIADWQVRNVVWDEADDRVRVFDYLRAASTERARLECTCAVVPMPFTVPDVAVVPRGIDDPIPEPTGRVAVALELDAFNERFEARGDDPRAVVALLDQRMMQTLLHLPITTVVHVRENRMLLLSSTLAPGDVLVLLRTAAKLAERVPRVVASLYPPRPAEGPYEDRWLQGSWSPDPTGADAPNPGHLGG
jgi:hypothetical protein